MTETNEKAKQAILDMLNEDDMPVVFIGAGLSRPPYPLWEELIKQLAERIGYQEGQKLMGDPLAAALTLRNHNEMAFSNAIIEMFSQDPNDCSQALLNVAKIDFKAFLTTSFDRCIERAMRVARRPYDLYTSASRLCSYLCRDQRLFFLHGRVDDNDDQPLEIVFTEEEYENAYSGAKGHVATFLFDVFAQNNVIFTGFSFSKYEPLNYVLRGILSLKSSQQTQPTSNWKILLPHNDGTRDPDFLDNLDQAGVHIIDFDKIDSNFKGLGWVWEQVATEFNLKVYTQPKPQEDPISIPKKGEGYV